MAKTIKDLKSQVKKFLTRRFFKKKLNTFKKHFNKLNKKIKKNLHYSLFIILLLLLFASFWPRYGFGKAIWEVGKWPKDAHLHLALAEEYVKIHNFDLVQKEVSQALSLDSSSVFNHQTYLEKIFAEKIKKQNLEKEIRDWEEVLKEYPGFRDVYLKLALLYWQLNDDLMADVYLKKASLLSPNDPTVLQLHQFFQKNR